MNAMRPGTTQTTDGPTPHLAEASMNSTLRSRGSHAHPRGILAVMTLRTSGYKTENPSPADSAPAVGHDIAQLAGITGNFCGQLCSYKTSGRISRGDHVLSGPHLTALQEQRWLLAHAAESPELTCCCPKSEMPRQSNHKSICAMNHIIHILVSHKVHFLAVFHENAPSLPGTTRLAVTKHNTGQSCRLYFMSLKCFDCIKYLTPLTMTLKRLPKMQSLQKERKHKRRLYPSNNFKEM